MSANTKAITLPVLGLLALVAGNYLAGFLVLWRLGLTDVPLDATTYSQYFRAMDLPQVAPYVSTIQWCGALGFALPLAAWVASIVPLLRVKPESMHGDARFATLSDLKKAGLLAQTPQSILIGKYKGRYLWLGGAQHVITISPTRSGKTTSVAIPVLLSYEQSMVVLDLKGELHKATSGWRHAKGQVIRVWAPYDEDGNTHRFNPLTTLAGMHPDKRIGEIQTIAAILYPDEPGKDPFWTSQSRAVFTAFTSYLFEVWDRGQASPGSATVVPPDINASTAFPSFERILHFSSGGDEHGTKERLNALLNDSRYTFMSPQTRTVFGNLAGLADQTFSSVIASMHAPLQQFLSPILAAATNATDIDITSLRRVPTTLYVIIPTNKLDESAKLLNIFFSTVIGNNLGKQLGEEPDLKYQVLMLMDEFTAMGRVDVWAKRISIAASYGVRDLCIVQSRAQLRAAYGDHDAQNFITNHGAQIVFAPREQSDANEYSEMLGFKTLRKQHRSTSHGGGSRQVSTNHTEERRALMLPQEIKELPADDELIFYEGSKPIRARKNWFFKDKIFQQRASLPPVIVRRAKPRADTPTVVTDDADDADDADEAEPPAIDTRSAQHHRAPGNDQCGSIGTKGYGAQYGGNQHDDEGARPTSLRGVHKLATPDPFHDQQLRRDLEIVNALTRKEFGSYLPASQPAEPKRKPNLPRKGADQTTTAHGSVMPPHADAHRLANHPSTENESMNIQQLAFAAAVVMAPTAVSATEDIYATSVSGTHQDDEQPIHFVEVAHPVWPDNGIAERILGDDDVDPENMFVESLNGKLHAWVLLSPVHGQAKALDFFSGEIQNIKVRNPGEYANGFIDEQGVRHSGNAGPDFDYKGPRPGGKLGGIDFYAYSLDTPKGVSCVAESLYVSRRMRDPDESEDALRWSKIPLYRNDSPSHECLYGFWDSFIGTALDLRDGTLLLTAGRYVFRVRQKDMTPVGNAPNLRLVNADEFVAVLRDAAAKSAVETQSRLHQILNLP